MTSSLISTEVATPQTMNGNDQIYVREKAGLVSVSVVSTDYPVYVTGANNTLVVLGEVMAQYTLAIQTTSTATGFNVYIGPEGTLSSFDDFLITANFLGAETSITNYGTVLGNEGLTVLGADSDIVNHGSITGWGGTGYLGVGMGGGGTSLVNYGTIDSTGTGVQITNGSANLLTNAGMITGNIGIKVAGGASNSVLTNSGTVIGTGGVALDIAGSNVHFTNSGILQGNIAGIGFLDTIVNSGHIDGDVSLGSGNDVYDGRGGTVSGTVSGGFGNDTYYVDKNTQIIELSGDGNDTVYASGHYALADEIEALTLLGASDLRGMGNSENNTIIGNSGANKLAGSQGNDTISGGDGNDSVYGGGGFDSMFGQDGDDVMSSGAGNDTLDGGEGNDILYGRRGSDLLIGDDGSDLLFGGDSADNLQGGKESDTLVGGEGSDQMSGGSGNDVFVWNLAGESPNSTARDRINGYEPGIDVLDLSAFLPDEFDINIGGALTGGGTASLRTLETLGDTQIYVDVDGDGSADMRIDVQGVLGLTGADFLV